MKLISCQYCGSVLDLNRIDRPSKNEYRPIRYKNRDNKDDEIIFCPVCKNKIFYSSGDRF